MNEEAREEQAKKLYDACINNGFRPRDENSPPVEKFIPAQNMNDKEQEVTDAMRGGETTRAREGKGEELTAEEAYAHCVATGVYSGPPVGAFQSTCVRDTPEEHRCNTQDYNLKQLHDCLDGKPGAMFIQNIAIAAATHTLQNHSGIRFEFVMDLVARLHKFQTWSEEDNQRFVDEASS